MSVFISAVLLCLVASTEAFRWTLDDVLPSNKYFTFSERYMFATHNGPFLMEQGSSYIHTDLVINSYTLTNRSVEVAFAVFATDDNNHNGNIQGLCDKHPEKLVVNHWAQELQHSKLDTIYSGRVSVISTKLGLNGTYYKRTIKLDNRYMVLREAWHNVVFQICPNGQHFSVQNHQVHTQTQSQLLAPNLTKSLGLATEQTGNAVTKSDNLLTTGSLRLLDTGGGYLSLDPVGSLEGTITFHNPYGFIPAELYGMLPFEAARMIAYILFSCYFGWHYYLNRDSILPLHNAFLVVFVFALAEATLWFIAYEALNTSGQPYCCPFPPTVVGALVLQVFRQTMSRTLLLVVCLGYGIVRPKLMTAEWMAISVVSMLYLVCAIVAQVSDILLVRNAHGEDADPTVVMEYRIPEMIMDVLFLTWIYLAISSTIRILTEFQQTVKLKMYKQLVLIIGVFVALFAVMTVAIMLASIGILSWPWQWSWLQQVIWESLNFAVLAAVCVVCKPAENSRLLSYASQLPTEDPDDYLDDEELHVKSGASGGDDSSGRYGRGGTNDDDDDDDGLEMIGRAVGAGRNDRNPVFDSLPVAEDEEYGLQDDED